MIYLLIIDAAAAPNIIAPIIISAYKHNMIIVRIPQSLKNDFNLPKAPVTWLFSENIIPFLIWLPKRKEKINKTDKQIENG